MLVIQLVLHHESVRAWMEHVSRGHYFYFQSVTLTAELSPRLLLIANTFGSSLPISPSLESFLSLVVMLADPLSPFLHLPTSANCLAGCFVPCVLTSVTVAGPKTISGSRISCAGSINLDTDVSYGVPDRFRYG